MKRIEKSELAKRFRKEMIERKKMNYLHGGDGDGGQGAPPDPWE